MDDKTEDGSMSGGSDFEVIEETEEEESQQQQQPTEEGVEEDGQHQSMVATKDVNVPTATGNGVELGWHMDNLNLGNLKRTQQLEKQLLEERLLTSEMKVAKLEAEKSELNTRLEMMELKAGKSGEENQLLKQKLEHFGTSIGKLEELKLLGEEFQAFKDVVLEQAKQQVEKKSTRQQSKLKGAIAQTEAKFSIQMSEIRRETILNHQLLERALDQQRTKNKQLDLQLTKFKEDIQRLDNKQPAAVHKQTNQPKKMGKLMFQNVSLVQFPVYRLLIAGDNDHGSGSAAWKFGNDYLTVTKLSLVAWASVIAEQPFPVAHSASVGHGRRLLFYFEVTVLQLKNYVCIGLCGPGFPLTGALVGDCAGSFAISSNGSYGADGHWQRNGLPGGFGDVVGFGMLLLPFEGSRLFFTKNGRLLGKQFTFTSEQMKGNFYPAVSAYHAGTSVKLNLGDNLAAKPFRYNLCHLKQIRI